LNWLLALKQILTSASFLLAILLMVGWILWLMSYNENRGCFLSPIFLGLAIGGDLRKKLLWQPIVSKVKERLSS
jgi:hypothetical protein